MELNFDQIHHYWEHRHPGQRIGTRNKVAVKCAFHNDSNPSCVLYLDGNGGFNCMGCGAKGNLFQFEMRFSECDHPQAMANIAAITGAKPTPRREGEVDLGAPVALYDYRDGNGLTVYQKRRFEPELGKKTFRIFHQTERGWRVGIEPREGPKSRRVLYNLPDVIKANICLISEGEKDADNLLTANLFAGKGYSIAATTSYDGAWKPGEKPKWLDIYSPYFTGKLVFIFPDNDPQGLAYADHIAQSIAPFAYQVRIVQLPGLLEKQDVSDFLVTRTVEDLEKAIRESLTWKGNIAKRVNYLVEAVEWASSGNEQIDWLVEGVIPAGGMNGIIAAEPKVGKSLAALDLLLSMACGIPWLGCKVPRRVRCAYISREGTPTLTKVRIQGLLRGKGIPVDLEERLWINTREQLGNFDVDDEEQFLNMAHDLKEREIEFTVFDVLNRLHSRDENNNTEMAQVVQKISRIGELAGCSIGPIHHVNKETGGGRFFTRIRGASALHGWTEWSMGLSIESSGDGTSRTIRKSEFENKAGELAPIKFLINAGEGGLSLSVLEPEPPDRQKHDGLARYRN